MKKTLPQNSTLQQSITAGKREEIHVAVAVAREKSEGNFAAAKRDELWRLD
jgi:hypothetical protein